MAREAKELAVARGPFSVDGRFRCGKHRLALQSMAKRAAREGVE